MTRTPLFASRRGGAAGLAVAALLAVVGPAGGRAEAGYYTVADLGNLGTNAPMLTSTGLNAGGAVVGTYNDGAASAFLAAGGPMASIGNLGGGASYAQGINDNGVVVGYSSTGSGYDVFTYTKAGGMVDATATHGVGLSGTAYNFATDINNSGQIVGYANPGGGTHAFFYNGTTTKDLGTLAGFGSSSEAFALNNSGQIVGESANSLTATSHAFLYSGGTMDDLGTIGGSTGSSVAYDINASGEVVGNSYVNNTSIYHAFLYNGTTMIDLTPGAAYANYNSLAYGINTAGQAVGSLSTDAFTLGGNSFSSHGFLYSGGVLTDLNTLVNPTQGWTILSAYGINDAGQISVLAANNQGQSHVLLLSSPAVLVDEPPTLVLLCSGVVLGLGLRRASRRELTTALTQKGVAEEAAPDSAA